VVRSQLEKIKQGLLEDGTAIGEGLATAVSRLKDSDAKSKVIILLTDGVSNRGAIDPVTASDLALQFGIRVYTIGVGSNGEAMTPVGKYPNGQWVFKPTQVEIDEKTLQEVASKTGGRYFRATDEAALREIYQEIDKMEKTRIEVAAYTRKSEEFHPFALIAGFFFLLDVCLNYTLVRSLP
jgi:Ca-activated chloride channel family protein